MAATYAGEAVEQAMHDRWMRQFDAETKALAEAQAKEHQLAA